jgi:uncharacterized membrane-anchored protein YhcB (DUF1043 family)
MSEPINIKTQSLPELKALAFDLQRLSTHYSTAHQTVLTEINEREQATVAQAEPQKEAEPEAPAKKAKLSKA